MNVLILGNGGREHALAETIRKSPKCGNLFIAPGNAGTVDCCISVLLPTNSDLLNFCISENISLVVVGPEKYLVDGTVDFLREKGVTVFGPGASAAQIESDKLFAKKLMVDNHVPTAAYKSFSVSSSKEDIYNYLRHQRYPIVIKANGLAAGKGVSICKNIYDALDAILLNFEEKVFGDAGNQIVIEEFLEGDEASLFIISDGTDYYCLPPAQDHKRIGDGDTGKNTGGMGAYAPAFIISDELQQIIEETIVRPTLSGMQLLGTPFIGCLFCGLIITNEGPKVIEFNARFGDPETQAVMNVIQGDFLELLFSAAKGKINKEAVSYNGGVSVCVVTASGGYPDSYEIGYEIHGLERSNDKNVKVYHAGTSFNGDGIVTNGGRVLSVTSFVEEKDFEEAVKLAYQAIEKIHYEHMYYRSDIAKRAIKK